jgi:hypothetical protein
MFFVDGYHKVVCQRWMFEREAWTEHQPPKMKISIGLGELLFVFNNEREIVKTPEAKKFSDVSQAVIKKLVRKHKLKLIGKKHAKEL